MSFGTSRSPPKLPGVDRTELSRITAFSDSVMAVAITLLVLNVNSPTVPASQLPERLDDLLTPLAAYALSFALVGRFWIIHHRHFACFTTSTAR